MSAPHHSSHAPEGGDVTAPSPTMVEVLATHKDTLWHSPSGRFECRCGRLVMSHLDHVAQALADAGVLGPEQTRTFPDGYDWSDLMTLLDAHWPEGIFPTLPDTDQRDPGPRIVSLLRWVDRLTAERQGIIDAIAAREAEYHESSWDAYREGRRDAYDDAERIARGES